MELSQDHIERLKKIKMLVMDVDGVMTDGRIFHNGTDWVRQWSVRDGAGIVLLKAKGYTTAIITGAKSVDVDMRSEHLKIDHLYKGKSDKSPAYEDLKSITGFKDEEISYIGDDVFDIPVLQKVGFSCTVADAVDGVKDHVVYVSGKNGGFGAIRELTQIISKHGYYAQQENS